MLYMSSVEAQKGSKKVSKFSALIPCEELQDQGEGKTVETLAEQWNGSFKNYKKSPNK